jgi:hypothetical protein
VWIKRYCALKSFKGWNWYSTRRWEAGRQKWRSAFSLSTQFKIMRFNPGRIVATPGALNVLARNGDSGRAYLKRHANGDWGVIGDEDKAENEFAVGRRLRIMSAYLLTNGTKIWVITEADRSSTCILLPSEY